MWSFNRNGVGSAGILRSHEWGQLFVYYKNKVMSSKPISASYDDQFQKKHMFNHICVGGFYNIESVTDASALNGYVRHEIV